MRKRLFSTLLALCMALALLPSMAFAAEATSGTCGDNVTWTLNRGTLTISGNGAMQDYASAVEVPWFSWSDQIKTVVINYGVTSIGGRVFSSCRDLTSVTIPDSVTSIGKESFRSCYGLTSVTIPNSVTSMGEGTFYDCTGLTSIQVDTGNRSYTSVDGVLFTKDTKTLIIYPGGKRGPYTIPSDVASIGRGAFFRCEGLTSAIIPNSVTSMGEYAFSECYGLTSVTIPNSVTSIGTRAFSWCTSLTSVTIPGGVTSIEERAFRCCYGLTSVTIPDSVTSIGRFAFSKCTGITSVTIPTSVTSIGACVFIYSGLTDVYYAGTKEQWEAIDISDENDVLKSAAIHYNNTTPTQSPQLVRFTDVPSGQWYSEPVAWAVAQGITNGTTPTTFSPNQSCTEIQILTFLWRAAGKSAANTDLPAAVIGADDYISAAKWACSKGMIDASFKQDAPCTRARAVMFMWRAAGSPAASGKSFTDVAADADYAQAVAWAVSRGITSGTSATTFSPDNVCSRGEIVTFLYRDMA